MSFPRERARRTGCNFNYKKKCHVVLCTCSLIVHFTTTLARNMILLKFPLLPSHLNLCDHHFLKQLETRDLINFTSQIKFKKNFQDSSIKIAAKRF